LNNPFIRPVSKEKMSIHLEGGKHVLAMIHGFTSNPLEFSPLARLLHAEGYTIDARLLPHHGGTVQELNKAEYIDWLDFVEEWFDDLAGRYETVSFIGFSLGSMLTLWLAAKRPSLHTAIVMATALIFKNMNKYQTLMGKNPRVLLPKTEIFTADDPEMNLGYQLWPAWAFQQTMLLQKISEHILGDIKCPILAIHGLKDRLTPPENLDFLEMMNGSGWFEKYLLENDGHNLPLSMEKKRIAQEIHRFLESLK
jgi:carboxylesterase